MVAIVSINKLEFLGQGIFFLWAGRKISLVHFSAVLTNHNFTSIGDEDAFGGTGRLATGEVVVNAIRWGIRLDGLYSGARVFPFERILCMNQEDKV